MVAKEGSMPRVFRIMYYDQVDRAHPRIGERFACLGVRDRDIGSDPQGDVRPCRQGMSVQPNLESLRHLPPTMVPARYGHTIEGAAGSDEMAVWMMGKGEFRDGPVAPKLNLECTSAYHGVVGPSCVMPRQSYQTALADTQMQWTEV